MIMRDATLIILHIAFTLLALTIQTMVTISRPHADSLMHTSDPTYVEIVVIRTPKLFTLWLGRGGEGRGCLQ